MEHDLELFSPILEILEIGVCNIIYNPGNIGKRIFSLSPILEIVDRRIHISVLSWKQWIVRSIYQSYPRKTAVKNQPRLKFICNPPQRGVICG